MLLLLLPARQALAHKSNPAAWQLLYTSTQREPRVPGKDTAIAVLSGSSHTINMAACCKLMRAVHNWRPPLAAVTPTPFHLCLGSHWVGDRKPLLHVASLVAP